MSKSSENQLQKPKTSKVSLLVFLATLAVVLISLTTVVFPFLVTRSASPFVDTEINPFETGVWTYPFLATNLILLGVAIAYKKNKLPQQITGSIRFIFSFEISIKVAFVTMLVLLAIYVAFSAGELATEEHWGDYLTIKNRLQGWTINDITKSFEPHVRFLLLSASLDIFGNIRVLPFIVSIALLVLTYYTTKMISKKRFAGIISVVILLQSSLFLSYDTSATYDNLWCLLYLLSLYMVYRKWPVSPISYILSISSKALTAVFLPMTMFFIYRSDIQKKTKIRIAISYGIIIVAGIAALSSGIGFGGVKVEFSEIDFWHGFTSWAFQLRFDPLVLVFLLPLVFGLFVASRHGIIHADSIMILIMGMLLIAPLLSGFTDQTNQPYRFVPLIAFFAIGIGTLLSKKSSAQA